MQRKYKTWISEEEPYKGFQITEPVFHKKEGRYYIFLYNPITNKRSTTSLARYKMSIFLKRELLKNEQVDHIDENKSNDDISNLQILSQIENIRKSLKPKILTELKCNNCGNTFKREKRQLKKGLYAYCSKKCMYIYFKKSRKGINFGGGGGGNIRKWNKYRDEILKLHNQGLSVYKMAEILNIPRGSIWRYIKQYKEN